MKTLNIDLIGNRKIITILEGDKIVSREVYVKGEDNKWYLEEKQKQKEN